MSSSVLRESLTVVRNEVAPRMKPFESQLTSATALYRESSKGGKDEETSSELLDTTNIKGRLKRNSLRRSSDTIPYVSSVGGRVQRANPLDLDADSSEISGGSVVASMSATARVRRQRMLHLNEDNKMSINPSRLSIPLTTELNVHGEVQDEKQNNHDAAPYSFNPYIGTLFVGFGAVASTTVYFS